MLIKAEQKFLRMSPRKLRLVGDSIRGVKSPTLALAYLENMNKRASLLLIKVIKQGLANAKNGFGLEENSLFVKELLISGGASYKRGRPGAKGMFKPIKKKTSHIKVVLESKTQVKGKAEKEKEEVVEVEKSRKKEEHGAKS